MTQDQILAELNAMILAAACEQDANAMIGLKQHIEGTVVVTPPPDAEWSGKCANFARTIYHRFDWSAPGNMVIDANFSGNDILVATFVTPDKGPAVANSVMNIGVAPFPGNQRAVGRTLCVSAGTPACDLIALPGFRTTARAGIANLYLSYESEGPHGYGVIHRNTRYYVTVANFVNGAPTAPRGDADFRLEIIKPQGL